MHRTIQQMGRALLMTLLGIGAGCMFTHRPPPPPPPAPPPVDVKLSHFVGSPLSGPTTQPVIAANALSVRVTFIALESMPAVRSESIGTAARLIAVEKGGDPVLPTPRLTVAARLVAAANVDALMAGITPLQPPQAFTLGTPHGALPLGATAAFDALEHVDTPRFVAGQMVHRQVRVLVYRPAATDPAKPAPPMQVALVMEDLVTPLPPAERSDLPQGPPDAKTGRASRKPPPPPPALPPVLQREVALIDRAAGATADRFALVVPFRFDDSSSRVLVAVVDIAPRSATLEDQQALVQCMSDIAQSIKDATDAQAHPYSVTVNGSDWPGYNSALQLLQHPEHSRETLVSLANETGATVCGDVALEADDASEKALAEHVLKNVAAAQGVKSREALAWVLDRSAFEVMCEQQTANKISPELAETLTRLAGEAGRHAGSVDEALQATNNPQDFEVRLTAENYIFLEDSSPASRVRAYDWLRARDRAPAGYNPLDPARARRAALEKALTTPATTPANTPPTAGPSTPSAAGETP